jgi:hypothetical protein
MQQDAACPRAMRFGHLPICFGQQAKRRPGTGYHSNPGPSTSRQLQRRASAGSICLPRPRAVQRGVGGGAVSEPICRVYHCLRCGVEARVCSGCDHGRIYCAGECSKICRRESLQHAGARYQRTRRGAHRHAARQRRWRQRQTQHPAPVLKVVTHHACSARSMKRTVSAALKTGEQAAGDEHENNNSEGVGSSGSTAAAAVLAGRCDFCQARDVQSGSGPGSVTSHGTGVASAAAALRGTT